MNRRRGFHAPSKEPYTAAGSTTYLEPKQYRVEKVAERDHDDFTLVWWKQRLYDRRELLSILSLSATSLYLFLRAHYILKAQNDISGLLWWLWLYWASEAIGYGMSSLTVPAGLLKSLTAPSIVEDIWRILVRTRRDRPRLRLIGAQVPTVDIIITVCGEDIEVIMDTVRAACVIDYPRDPFRVVVSDDGVDHNLQECIGMLQKSMPNLHYYTRPKYPGVHHGCKAGNINQAMRHVETLEGGPGEYFAILDADMIPEPQLLRALLAHMVNSPRIAMAIPPQVLEFPVEMLQRY